MKNIEDIARMGYVIMNFDDIEYDDITTTGYLDENGQPSPMVKISKKIDGTHYDARVQSPSLLYHIALPGGRKGKHLTE